MYLTLTQTATERTTTTRRSTPRPVTRPAPATPRTTGRHTTPDPLIHAWARRAMAANGFGDAGC